MSSPPLPPDKNEPQKAADLSHFQQNKAESVPYKKRGISMGGITSAIDNLKKPKKPKPAAGESVFAKHKKNIILGVAAAVVIPAVIIVGIKIPDQISRSKAFSAYEEGRYDDSLRDFRDYMQNNPGDAEAAFYSARAAINTGDFQYASDTMGKIANAPGISQNPEFLFYHALALAPDADSIPVLNKLVSASPSHVGGRLLRGILLTREKDFQRAREDFLKVDSIIRGGENYDGNAISQVHSRIASLQNFLPSFDTKSAVSADAPVLRRLSGRLGVPVAPEIYISRYLPSLPAADDSLAVGDDDWAEIYYTLLLLANNQTEEAKAQISGLTPEVMASSAGSLEGIYHVLNNDYPAAEKVFRQLVNSPAPQAEIFFNLANIIFNASPTDENARAAIALLSDAINMNPALSVARHNRAVLQLWLGEFDGAADDMAALQQDTPQTPLLRALIALSLDPRDENIAALLQNIETSSPAKTYILAAHLIALGKYGDVLLMLQGESEKSAGWEESDRLYAQYLANIGLWLRARHLLTQKAPQDSPDIRYQIALINLQIGETEKAEATLAVMESQNGDSIQTAVLRALILWRTGEAEKAATAITDALQAATSDEEKWWAATEGKDILLEHSPDVLRELLSQSPPAGSMAQVLSAQLTAQEKPKAAAAVALEASARHPFFEIQRHAGIALAIAGRNDEAAEVLQAAIEWSPVNIPVMNRLRELYAAAGRAQDEARITRIIRNIVNFHKKPEDGEKDDHSEVIKIEAPGNNKAILSAIAQTRANKAPVSQAADMYKKLIADAAADDDAKAALIRYQFGTFLLSSQEYADAETEFRAALLSGLLPPLQARRAKFYLGKALTSQRKFSEGAEIYEELAKENPDISLYRRMIGNAMIGDKNLEAVSYLRESARLFPADIENYYALVAALRQAEQSDEAISVLRKVARIAPLYAPTYIALSRIQQITDDIISAKKNSVIVNELTSKTQK